MAQKVATNLGNGWYEVSFSETNISVSTEVQIVGLPKMGRIMRAKFEKTGGSATQLNPIVGTATDPGGVTRVYEYDVDEDVSTDIDVQPGVNGALFNCTGVLYHRTVPDTGSDTDTNVYYLIKRES